MKQPKASARASKRKRKKRLAVDLLPSFCDYACDHAAFTPADAMGACRREIGVYCTLLDRYNNKNAVCLVKSGRHS